MMHALGDVTVTDGKVAPQPWRFNTVIRANTLRSSIGATRCPRYLRASRAACAAAIAGLLLVPSATAFADRAHSPALRTTEARVALGTVSDSLPKAMPLAGASAHDALWHRVRVLCGRAYAGTVVEAPAGDTTFAGKALVMHVLACGKGEIRIPFHVGVNRSRTWVLIRTEAGLRLKHDHRHEDGSPDSVTQYGGDARLPGKPGRLEFPADAFTARLIPRAAANVWTLEVEPGRRFVYALRREGTDRRFRIEFDLTRPVPAPPLPWGTTKE